MSPLLPEGKSICWHSSLVNKLNQRVMAVLVKTVIPGSVVWPTTTQSRTDDRSVNPYSNLGPYHSKNCGTCRHKNFQSEVPEVGKKYFTHYVNLFRGSKCYISMLPWDYKSCYLQSYLQEWHFLLHLNASFRMKQFVYLLNETIYSKL